jgi:thymidylate synthase (FAD)
MVGRSQVKETCMIEFSETGLPFIRSWVYRTPGGVPYLKEAGVAMVSRPHVDLTGVQDFLDGFDADLGFQDYLDDPTDLPPAEALVKFMGQACYLSMGPKRTYNNGAAGYFDNLKSSGHGSVFEHANFSFFIWGIDRSVTHELVRHRAGFGFSQVSQRYVDGTKLRFVERPEYQPDLLPSGQHLLGDAARDHRLLRQLVGTFDDDFQLTIENAKAHYDRQAELLMKARELGHPMLQGGSKTELRKMVNQVARECLPNCTEAPIGVTANVRAWRHACEMRANSAAEVLIRAMAMKVYRCIHEVAPILFDDYQVVPLETSGTEAISTPNRKV